MCHHRQHHHSSEHVTQRNCGFSILPSKTGFDQTTTDKCYSALIYVSTGKTIFCLQLKVSEQSSPETVSRHRLHLKAKVLITNSVAVNSKD